MKREWSIEYYAPFQSRGYTLWYVENSELGLRRVDFAHKILGLRYTGWFTYDEGDLGETLRGVVYQLPARGGRAQYVYGYVDSNSDGVTLCFDPVEGKEEAARLADDVAERVAESERDYHRAWDAGRRVESLNEEIAEGRREVLDLGAEAREARKKVGTMPVICGVVRGRIREIWRVIQRARKERDELIENFGREPGFVE